MKKSGGFRNRILGAAAVLAVSATPVLAGLVSIPMPTDGDSYYIKGWKRPLVMAVPANLGHSTLDFVAKSLVRKTGTLILEARTLDDKFLWEYDTKIPPELTEDQNGMHEPCVPWDLDGDGIDEVITMWFDMTTKPPTPYVVVLNGQTGKEKGKIKLPPGGGTSGGNTQNQPWGIGAHYCCIAYLDGAEGKPYFCISQGIYRDGAVWAFYWDSKTNNIALKWTYQYNSKVRDWGLGGTSTHGLTSYDTNGDGREEIVFGGTLLSADGVKLWSLCDTIGAGHVDGVTPGHLDPNLPGNQVYYHIEWYKNHPTGGRPIGAACMVRASDGSVLWLHEGNDDCHAGWACHITDDYPGAQCRAWCVDQSIDTVYTADGKDLHIKPDVHRPPEWRGGDVYDTETGLLTRQRDGFSYAADVGGGPMHGSEEIIYCRYGSQSVQIKFNKDAKPYPSRWENRHYRQDVASCGAGYGGFKDVFKVCELGPAKPGIYLACPNSAQTWKVGTQKTVTWASFGAPPRVNIELSTDGGAHWVRLAGNVANSGSQDVWVPATPSTTCRVRVIGAPPAYTSGHFGQEVVVAAPTQALDGVYSSASSVDFTIEE